MDRPEHDSVMTEMFVQAHNSLPPLAFHAWAACSFASRQGLLTDEELDALGLDAYAVLFALEARGVLAQFARAVEVPSRNLSSRVRQRWVRWC